MALCSSAFHAGIYVRPVIVAVMSRGLPLDRCLGALGAAGGATAPLLMRASGLTLDLANPLYLQGR